ncbi:MAG: aminotransferase class I/II-fold pyridoxal phosphate-dependent enzyme [Clostridiales bacterium]|nr:aminotransferase class I/II-fold pyridoxal phosphate-dependent enzyme [Clostridiales bacterium]
MYSFLNDYSECAHPKILEKLTAMGLEQNPGYGMDSYCTQAADLIRELAQAPSADVHFLPGGTITNLTLISHALRPYQAVISASTGHINVHETGAIEATGHKVIEVFTEDSKLTPELIQPVLDQHSDEHMVDPAMVYISNPTELGSVYTKEELENLSSYCRRQGLLLFLDGARLAMALAVKETHLALSDLARLTDAFYIGGTKVGALFGEALVITNDRLKEKFRFNIKQHGAMTAKGWLLGVQFQTLLEDGLYFEMGRHANEMMDPIRKAFADAGFSCDSDSPTNQLFPILPDALVEKINSKYQTSFWRKVDAAHTSIRFVTSWATKKEDVDAFLCDLKHWL